jgi:hypothetical protein
MKSHYEITIEKYNASQAKAHVLLSHSADAKWIAALYGKKPVGEWFAITKTGAIIADGTKQTVNRSLNNLGLRPLETECDAWA